MMDAGFFDIETPAGHEERILRSVAGELARNRAAASRRSWVFGALGGLVTAGLAFFFVRSRLRVEEPALFEAGEIAGTDLDPEFFADLPMEVADDFETFMSDLELLEEENV